MARIRRQMVWRHVLMTLLCGIGFLGGITYGDVGDFEYIPNTPELYNELLNSDIVVIGMLIGKATPQEHLGVKYELVTIDVEEWLKGEPEGEVTQVKVMRKVPVGRATGNLNDPRLKDEQWLARWEAFGKTLRAVPDKAAGVFILKKHESVAGYYPASWTTPLPFLAGDAVEAQLKVLEKLAWSEPVNGLSFGVLAGCNYPSWAKGDTHHYLRVRVLVKNVTNEQIRMLNTWQGRVAKGWLREGGKAEREVALYPETKHEPRVRLHHYRPLLPGEVAVLQAPNWVTEKPLPAGQYTLRISIKYTHPDLLRDAGKDNNELRQVWQGEAKLPAVRVVVNEESLKEPLFGGFRGAVQGPVEAKVIKEKN